jgi:hypothetical protein
MMGRAILGTVAGLLIAFGVVMLLEPLGHRLFDLPTLSTAPGSGERATYMDRVPFGAKLWLILVWFAATLAGAATAFGIGRVSWTGNLVAGLFLGATVANFLLLPHPIWMIALATILICIAPGIARRLVPDRPR